MSYDLDDALLAGWDAARTGASKLLEGYEESLKNRYAGVPFPEKNHERIAYASMRTIVSNAFPEHTILAKETNGEGFSGKRGPLWYIDSLDGAFNYMRNNHFFSLSISFLDNDEGGELRPLIGGILAPVLM